MKTVTVTGATGFVGSRLCERLIDDGWQVRRALRYAGSVQGVVVGDLGAQTDWSEALSGVDSVVHLAARVHEMRDELNDPLSEFRRVNVEATLNLAKQAADVGVRRFVYLSTVKVNGEQTCLNSSSRYQVRGKKGKEQDNCTERRALSVEKPGLFREDDVPHPQGAYAISKWEAEQGLMALARESEMEVVIIRPPLVYGPGVKGNFASMLRWVEKGIPIPLGAVRDNRRSFVSLDNLVDLIVTCLDHPGAANQVFLVSDGEDLSTADLLQRVANAIGCRSRLVPVPLSLLNVTAWMLGKETVANRLLGSLQVDNTKARELLGWDPPVSVEEALKRMRKSSI